MSITSPSKTKTLLKKKIIKKKSKAIAMPQKIIGWREAVSLLDLHIPHINVKVDTGALTSALHADNVKIIRRGGKEIVTFTACPVQRSNHPKVQCRAELLEYRNVRSSNGALSLRPVIKTTIDLGGFQWQIDLTLINRDQMGFRMLLGRRGIPKGFLVNAHRSYVLSKPVRRKK